MGEQRQKNEEGERLMREGPKDVQLQMDEAAVVMALDLASGLMSTQAQQLSALGRPEGQRILGSAIEHLQREKARFVAETQRRVKPALVLPGGH